MNLRPVSSSNRLSYSSQNVSLHPTSRNPTSFQSRQNNKPSKKSSTIKNTENQPPNVKSGYTINTQAQKPREKVQDKKPASVSVQNSKPIEEKVEKSTMPLREIKNGSIREIREIAESTEKSVKDLNNSLANLALRRCVGRSSSDNDMLGYLNNSKNEGNQRSYTTFNQPADYTSPCSNTKTPCITKRPVRGTQTSVQKDYDITPFALLNRDSDRFTGFRNTRDSENLTISNVDYGKFQGGMYSKSTRPTQNVHYVASLQDIQDNHTRHLMTEGSYRMELSHLDNFNPTTENYTPSHFLSNEMRLSDLHGDYIQDMGLGTTLRENQIAKHFRSEQENGQRKAVQNFGYVPAFKGFGRGKTVGQDNGNMRRFSELSGSGKGLMREPEKLELNSISDGVEYTRGGVGQNRNVGRKPRHTIRTKSSLTVTEECGRLDNVKKETLDSWKQDIMRIKKEMEMRKKSYVEVNELMRKFEDEKKEGGRVRKTISNMSGKVEVKQTYFSGMKGSSVQEAMQRRRKGNKKKISFEMKTTEDCEDQRSGVIMREEQISPVENKRAKTVPYYNFGNETHEGNNSFVYEDKVILESEKKPNCCGNKMCNIF